MNRLRRPTGEVVYLGRLKEVMRVGGENVSNLEGEGVLNAHPAVFRSAVVPAPHARLKEVPVAFVELRAGAAADESVLVAHCSQRLANFKLPRRIAGGMG